MNKTCFRVLIADDLPYVRKGLQALLETDERMVVIGTAVNGIQAINLAADLQPDLILMDVHMPSLDGYEAACRIMEKNPLVKIIFMVTKGEEQSLIPTEKFTGMPRLLKDQSEPALFDLIDQIFADSSHANKSG